jgi:hypothetical protein
LHSTLYRPILGPEYDATPRCGDKDDNKHHLMDRLQTHEKMS